VFAALVCAQDRPGEMPQEKEPKHLPWKSFGPDQDKGQGNWGADFGPHKKGKPDAAGGGSQPWTRYVPKQSEGAEENDKHNNKEHESEKDKEQLPWSSYGPKPPKGGPSQQQPQGVDWQKYLKPEHDSKNKKRRQRPGPERRFRLAKIRRRSGQTQNRQKQRNGTVRLAEIRWWARRTRQKGQERPGTVRLAEIRWWAERTRQKGQEGLTAV